MGKCIKCGANFVGTPENPPADALCRYCEIVALKAALEAAQAELEQVRLRASVRIERIEKLNNQGISDWAADHTHFQAACIKAGIPKEKVEGDSYGVPGIMELTDMLVQKYDDLETSWAYLNAELERVKEQVRVTAGHWQVMASDYRKRSEEWKSGDVMHTQRLAEAKTLENCAYALHVALLPDPPKGEGK